MVSDTVEILFKYKPQAQWRNTRYLGLVQLFSWFRHYMKV
jgi:hypothetical protein